ncbi:putative EthD domain-containing protein [Seiridium cardinale]
MLPIDSEHIDLSAGYGKFLCLTICGYRKKGMSEADYRHHMTQISAPMTKDLMVKYGIVRWVQIHNQSATKAMMCQLYDPQMANLADFDCFSQVTFKSLDDYKAFKQDPAYKQRLTGDHENFADTRRSSMTIGWVEQFIDGGVVVDGMEDPSDLTTGYQLTAAVMGSFLSGAMVSLSLITIPVFLDTTPTAGQLVVQWARTYHFGHFVLPSLSVATFGLYTYISRTRAAAGRPWLSWFLAGATTITMVPFTWIMMVPINNTLFQLEAAAKAGALDTTLQETQALVMKWNIFHFTRSLLPLAGAALGALATLKRFLF